MIKNLSQLKKAMSTNHRLEIVGHCRKECIGQIRQVTLVNTVGFYSIPQDLTEEESQRLNDGKGYVLWWKKAPDWDFEDGVCAVYNKNAAHTNDHLIMAFRILDKEEAA